MSDTGRRSVLLLHPGALGDVLLAVPAIRVIRNRYPSHRLVLAAGAETGRLLELCGIVDWACPLESREGTALFSGEPDRSSGLWQEINTCDAVVGWLRDGDGTLRAVFTAAGIPRIVLRSPAPRSGVHQRERFLDTVDGVRDGAPVEHGLVLPDPVKQSGADWLHSMGLAAGRSIVLCHPGSGSPAKCVRPEIFREVIRQLESRGLTPVVIEGPADQERVQDLLEQGLDRIPVLRRQPLTVLAGVMAQVGVFLGHDSGVTHLAAALHVPTVALFGPTDPFQWAPQGDHITIIRGRMCTCPDWDRVRNCSERPCLPNQPEEIVRAVATALSATNR